MQVQINTIFFLTLTSTLYDNYNNLSQRKYFKSCQTLFKTLECLLSRTFKCKENATKDASQKFPTGLDMLICLHTFYLGSELAKLVN